MPRPLDRFWRGEAVVEQAGIGVIDDRHEQRGEGLLRGGAVQWPAVARLHPGVVRELLDGRARRLVADPDVVRPVGRLSGAFQQLAEVEVERLGSWASEDRLDVLGVGCVALVRRVRRRVGCWPR